MRRATWANLKGFADARLASIQYIDESNKYYLWANDGILVLDCIINKDDNSDQIDFETNYKANGNKKIIPDTDAYNRTDQFAFAGEGFSLTATHNATTNLDYKITADRYINGLQMLCTNQSASDSATLQIVDKDNVLGYGANTVLSEFATNWQIADSNQDQGIIQLPFRGKIPANCYVRIIYKSTGLLTNVIVCANLLLHKKTV